MRKARIALAAVLAAVAALFVIPGSPPEDRPIKEPPVPVPVPPAALERPSPNVVLILTDDQGWADRESHSDFYRTPNTDTLAAKSVRYTNAYSAGPNCMPSRAAMLTGLYSPRTGVYTVGTGNRGLKQFRQLDAADNTRTLGLEFPTFADHALLRNYETSHVGKWHLGDPGQNGPEDHGFEHSIGGNRSGGVPDHFADESGTFPGLPGLGANGIAGQFLADRLTDETLAWITSRTAPFVAVLSHYSVHTPIQAPQEYIDEFEGVPGNEYHNHQVYAAMLKNLDDSVGRVVDKLGATEDPRWPGHVLLDNTLVIFYSDNGGLGGYENLNVTEYTHQHPLRGGKGQLYEGGVRVPLFMRWDGVLEPREDDRIVAGVDVFSTILDAIDVPEEEDDGLSLLEIAPESRSIYWHFPGYLEGGWRVGKWRTTPVSTMRSGPWKIMFFYETRIVELYRLDLDVGESISLAGVYPETVEEMLSELSDWLRETEAPMPKFQDTGIPVPYPDE